MVAGRIAEPVKANAQPAVADRVRFRVVAARRSSATAKAYAFAGLIFRLTGSLLVISAQAEIQPDAAMDSRLRGSD